MKKAIFKFNSSIGALLCSLCHCIIKTGKDFTYYEQEACKGNEELEEQFCNKCKEKINKELKTD